jgi:hypothetical protein
MKILESGVPVVPGHLHGIPRASMGRRRLVDEPSAVGAEEGSERERDPGAAAVVPSLPRI